MNNIRVRYSFLIMLGVMSILAGCSENDPAAPDPVDPGYQSRQLTRDDLSPEGDVVETADGYRVTGTLHVDNGGERTSFVNAELDVQFDAQGRVRNVSGRAEIPSPHERIEFADPVEADVGFFSGAYLNNNRDFNILLKDDTDYFVFSVGVSFEMRIATGETGEEAVRPIAVRAPLGGQILMIVDYDDPMYYIYGEQDLLGAAGMGWSWNRRIPFEPWYPVEDLGPFDGRNTRTGSFPVFKVLTVSGQMVDNEQTEVHLSLEDPFTSDLRMDYKVGYNGAMGLDLFLKDIAGLEIPIAEGSGGMWREVSVQDIFRGHAYVRGVTTDFSWWPAFIPARPTSYLETSGFVQSSGDFNVNIAGKFGWDLPGGEYAMRGGFDLSPEAMTLAGAVTARDVDYQIAGTVTAGATSAGVVPPQQLLDRISDDVNAHLDESIAGAEQAWEDLQDATADYEFELSLRGLRSALPDIVDTAKQKLSDGINAELKKHKGEKYYNSLKNHLYSADNKYYEALENLKAKARSSTDNDAWRNAIESALRTMAGYKYFETTYRYKVAGITVKTVKIKKRILSDSRVSRLNTAANNVKYIEETWDRKVTMQRIYDEIPDKEIFERVRGDIQDGVVQIPGLDELGFVFDHDNSGALNVYAVVGGERSDMGPVDVFDIDDLAAALAGVMVDVLIAE